MESASPASAIVASPSTTRPSPTPESQTASPTAAPQGDTRPTATAVPTAAAILDWPTYHRDNAHTGVDPTTESFSTVAPSWHSEMLDGDDYAEPLVVRGRVYAATNRNTVYALDAASGTTIWRTNLGAPILRSQLPCGNIDVTGITSTPVADAARGLLFVVTFIQPGRHELVALDLASGAVRYRQPIDPAGANPLTQQQRAGLVLSHGLVYVGYGGLWGDCGTYHGWLVAANEADGSTAFSYQVPSQNEGAIWAPSGPTVDSSGNLYASTGNSSSSGAFDFGNAVMRFTPTLQLADWFAPTNWVDLNSGDIDIGSVGPALLNNGLIFQIGKAGVGYLLQADHLGHIGGQAFSASVCPAAFGGTAYVPPTLYVPCTDSLVAVRIQDSPGFSVRWRVPMAFAGPPIVKAGAVWSIARDGTLYGIDPSSGAVRARLAVGTPMNFATPSVAGRLLLVAASRQVIGLELH